MTDKDIIDLITEVWKIFNIISISRYGNNVALNFSARKINKIIKNNNFDIVDLTGKKFDAGMSVDIIDKEVISNNDNFIIKEMIEPIILKNEKVIKYGKVIISDDI